MANNTYGILMPEVVLYKTIKYCLNEIQEDFNSGKPEEETMLYHFFGKDNCGQDIEFETFNYLEQAKDLFLRKCPQVNMGYNMETSEQVCVHILLPNETGRHFGIGADENYQAPIITSENGDDYMQEVYSKNFDANFQILVTSENTLEVLLVYNFLRGCFISLVNHLELAGLRNIRLGGHDINIQENLVPTHIFHRAFTISFFYEVHVPDFFRKLIIKDFQSTGIISVNNP